VLQGKILALPGEEVCVKLGEDWKAAGGRKKHASPGKPEQAGAAAGESGLRLTASLHLIDKLTSKPNPEACCGEGSCLAPHCLYDAQSGQHRVVCTIPVAAGSGPVSYILRV